MVHGMLCEVPTWRCTKLFVDHEEIELPIASEAFGVALRQEEEHAKAIAAHVPGMFRDTGQYQVKNNQVGGPAACCQPGRRWALSKSVPPDPTPNQAHSSDSSLPPTLASPSSFPAQAVPRRH